MISPWLQHPGLLPNIWDTWKVICFRFSSLVSTEWYQTVYIYTNFLSVCISLILEGTVFLSIFFWNIHQVVYILAGPVVRLNYKVEWNNSFLFLQSRMNCMPHCARPKKVTGDGRDFCKRTEITQQLCYHSLF